MTASTVQPPEVAELAARHQLGELAGAFAPKRLGTLMFVVYVNMILTFTAFFVVPGLLCYWWMRRFPNFSRKQAAKRLYLFEHGMIVQPQFGDGMTAFRWDSVKLYQDITQLFVNGVPTPTKYVYSVVAPRYGGAEITEFYENPESWGPALQDAVLRAQGPAVLKAILEGGTVDFGALSLSSKGVSSTRNGRLPWSEVQEILVQGGSVRVLRSGTADTWSTVAVSGMPNLYVFLAVAGKLCRQ
ncbi:hypothetical protein O1Q96_03575 [Streptomyces sp. Qhu-G9]|uniref:DUF6585 family protein n=1 Tax=Streptomyces sp. Qhu-G9 TaxID=3452799 RepID=UPI0022AC0859|nr:DUF6585 family protein [Streptomyces aurantiacus]WAU78914.1 hypothetical protein O1Q96_03575 [Streptomyces aurantiacus]